MRQPDKARPLLQQVVDHGRRVLGSQHPRTLSNIGSLGQCLAAMPRHGGDLHAAVELLEEAVAGLRTVCGEGHPNTKVFQAALERARRLSEPEPGPPGALPAPARRRPEAAQVVGGGGGDGGRRAGSRVAVHGLLNATDVNGRRGTVVSWHEGRGRFTARLWVIKTHRRALLKHPTFHLCFFK